MCVYSHETEDEKKMLWLLRKLELEAVQRQQLKFLRPQDAQPLEIEHPTQIVMSIVNERITIMKKVELVA